MLAVHSYKAGHFAPAAGPRDPALPGHTRNVSSIARPQHLAPEVQRSCSDVTPFLKTQLYSGSRREKIWSNLRRLSSTSFRADPNGPPLGLTRGKSERERNTNVSIDFMSPEGASAPQIVKAAQPGSRFEVMGLIKNGHDIEERHVHSHRSVLLVAAHRGNVEVVDLLLQCNARLDIMDKSGSMALHLAASRSHCHAVQLIISHDADIEAKDVRIITALHYACEEGHLGVDEIFLDNTMDINVAGCDRRTPLICAAATGRLSVVELLLNRKASQRRVDDGGMTALHWAAFNEQVDIVELLSRKKGMLAMTNAVGRTPLHLAVMKCQFSVVEGITRKETSIEICCHSGLTALYYACIANNNHITRLFAHGKIRHRSSNGERPSSSTSHSSCRSQRFCGTTHFTL